MKKEERWEEAYRAKTFLMNTVQASSLVCEIFPELRPGSRALDLGCGNGRNAIFLAQQGNFVDAVDIADIGKWHLLSPEARKRITFIQGSVLDREYQHESYDLALAIRLFQYLPARGVETLIGLVSRALKPGGLFLIAYTSSGGIFDEESVAVEKHAHAPEWVRTVLEKHGFQNIEMHEEETRTSHVPYSRPATIVTIRAQK